MKIIKIKGKEYKIVFSMEASLYDECTASVSNLVYKISESQSKEDISAYLKSMANVPATALSMFYAGLLEHHGEDEGDGTIKTKKDAKKLLMAYFEEHKEDGSGNFHEIMSMMMECMEDDGFFKLIGLGNGVAETKTPKVPQDHKKPQKATQK